MTTVIALGVIIIVQEIFMYVQRRDHKAQMKEQKDDHKSEIEQLVGFGLEKERQWAQERKDLMDRIQAPSFAEYTSKVIKEKKLEQPQEEEKPVEFIS